MIISELDFTTRLCVFVWPFAGSSGIFEAHRQLFIIPHVSPCFGWRTASLYTLYVSGCLWACDLFAQLQLAGFEINKLTHACRGLILQDLTFVNIGNADTLPDGSVNFVKRWQQFAILDNMRRFDKRWSVIVIFQL